MGDAPLTRAGRVDSVAVSPSGRSKGVALALGSTSQIGARPRPSRSEPAIAPWRIVGPHTSRKALSRAL